MYKLNDKRAVKIFFETMSHENIMKEYAQTLEGSKLNINAVGCCGLVRSKGRIGIERELINGVRVEDEMANGTASPSFFGMKMAEELKLIHSRTANKNIYPDAKNFYLDCAEKCVHDKWLDNNESVKIKKFIEALPVGNSLIYGDYHSNNVLWENNKIRLIDIADALSGHAIYDLLVAALYMHFFMTNPESSLPSTPEKRERRIACWAQLVNTYFELDELKAEDNARAERIIEILDACSLLKLTLAPYSFSNLSQRGKELCVALGKKTFMPVIEKYTGVVTENILDLGKA
ncbi:MAG: phosphotransferase [Synergistaceae bacterium]|nr:phosphotransferase [Synergistaceae bacterium]